MLQDVEHDRPAPPRVPAPTARRPARLADGSDALLSTMWAMHPCALFDPSNRPGPFFQFRVPDEFEWNRVTLPVPNLPRALEGLRIVHVTDFHFHRVWKAPYDELLRRIAADPPDLLLSGGDYVEDKHDHRPALPMVMRLVKGFRAKLGVFGILGNHDSRKMEGPLRRQPAMTLIDGTRRAIPIGHDGTTIEIVGLPGVHRDELRDDFVHSLGLRRENSLRIVLAHFPDQLPRVQYPMQPDLFLAGHTHGGQVCLPGGYPIIRHDKSPRRLCTGIHWVDRTWMIVNRGFGFSGLPVRLFCPAEVLDIRLTRMT